MNTYQFTTSSIPGVFGTMLIDSLSAQKHFLLNACYKHRKMSTDEKQRLRKADVIQFSGDPYDEEIMNLIRSSEIPRYAAFTKVFRGKKTQTEAVIDWAAEFTKKFESLHMCLWMRQTRDGIIPLEEGPRIRPALGFERKDAPICLLSKNEQTPMLYVYLMLIGLKEMP